MSMLGQNIDDSKHQQKHITSSSLLSLALTIRLHNEIHDDIILMHCAANLDSYYTTTRLIYQEVQYLAM
jgi:hypothetical protein